MSMNCFGMTFSIVLHFLLLANYPSCKYLKKEEIISSFRSLIMLYNCKCRAKFKHNCFGMTFSIVLQQPAQLSVGPTPPTRPATPSLVQLFLVDWVVVRTCHPLHDLWTCEGG